MAPMAPMPLRPLRPSGATGAVKNGQFSGLAKAIWPDWANLAPDCQIGILESRLEFAIWLTMPCQIAPQSGILSPIRISIQSGKMARCFFDRPFNASANEASVMLTVSSWSSEAKIPIGPISRLVQFPRLSGFPDWAFSPDWS